MYGANQYNIVIHKQYLDPGHGGLYSMQHYDI